MCFSIVLGPNLALQSRSKGSTKKFPGNAKLFNNPVLFYHIPYNAQSAKPLAPLVAAAGTTRYNFTQRWRHSWDSASAWWQRPELHVTTSPEDGATVGTAPLPGGSGRNYTLQLHPKMAPQLGQRLCLVARQQRMPSGKKKMAQKMPKQLKSSSRTPICQDIEELDQCPGIGKFGWETTPYGYCFSTLSL